MRGTVLAHIALSYPLGIVGERPEDEYLLRAPFAVNEDDSIVPGGAIRKGYRVVLMVGAKASAIEVTRRAAQRARRQLEGRKPRLTLAFSCYVRDKLYLERATQGAEGNCRDSREALGDAPVAGFSTSGEGAPLPFADIRTGMEVG